MTTAAGDNGEPEPDTGPETADESPSGDESEHHDTVAVPPESPEHEHERLLSDIDRLTAERDKHLDEARRLAADFANFRKQTDKRHADMASQAGAGLVERLLPVLDACDSAAQQGADDVVPIRDMFRDFLASEGLEVVDVVGAEFDPNVHEAVQRQEGDADHQVVTEILRTGYVLNGHVLRAAMVTVQG